ncbi:hypothetical protein [Nitrosovibrio sp. Nv6]|uniref:hypothetical protein n=1 Tax=Nitrosovibrio sp. Nv6 TaxID=1855340 RepID=UPI0008CCB85E|nr:hypothetical protein [Nitrosovibrio sp. Nv6]SEO73104.1 hypothetical protein SAMN05216316_0923 [Nitrosovibrio sp. Nv6]
MVNRQNFLSTLIQREHGGHVAHAISPRPPSRYEPVERNGPVAMFEETEPAGANRDTLRADAHHTPPPVEPDQGVRAERPENTLQPPASMVPLKEEVANTNAPSPSITLPLDEPVAEHERVAARKDLSPVDPASEPDTTKPARVEKRRIEATSRIEDTAGHEERSNTAKMPKGKYDGSPRHESEPRYKATEHPEGLPSANSHPPTYTEQSRPAKHNVVAAPQISDVTRQNGDDEHSNIPITVPEKLDNNPHHPTVATQVNAVATATTIPAPQPTAKHTVASTPRINSTGNIAEHPGHDSGAPPVSREVFPVQVTIGKSGGTTPPWPSRELPGTSSHREASTPAPAPTINVTIGRIEVRAVAAPATAKRNNAGPKPMSLDAYLSQHSGRRSQRGSQ